MASAAHCQGRQWAASAPARRKHNNAASYRCRRHGRQPSDAQRCYYRIPMGLSVGAKKSLRRRGQARCCPSHMRVRTPLNEPSGRLPHGTGTLTKTMKLNGCRRLFVCGCSAFPHDIVPSRNAQLNQEGTHMSTGHAGLHLRVHLPPTCGAPKNAAIALTSISHAGLILRTPQADFVCHGAPLRQVVCVAETCKRRCRAPTFHVFVAAF